MRTLESRAPWIEENAKKVARIYGFSRDDRDDYAQEAALRACVVWNRFPEADERYVFRAMNNAVIDMLRKSRGRMETSASDPIGATECELADALPDERPTPLEAVLAADEIERAWAIVDSLPEHLRSVFVAGSTSGMAAFARESGRTRRDVARTMAVARSEVANRVRESLVVAL